MKELLQKLIVTLLFATIIISSRANNFLIRQVSPPGGYSSKSINSITQDNCGFIWFATYNGVIRYNSKHSKHFLYDPLLENNLPSNTVLDIKCDADNNIWVATNNGIAKFNRESQKFERVSYSINKTTHSHDHIQNIEIEGGKRIWLSSKRYVGYLTPENTELKRTSLPNNERPSYLYKDSKNNIWVGCRSGNVFIIDKDNNKAEFKIKGNGKRVNTIYRHNEQLWVAHFPTGCRRYLVDSNNEISTKEKPHFYSEVNSFVRRILTDRNGQTWLGSYDGLFQIDNTNVTRVDLSSCSNNIHSSIYELFEDNQGSIWIGTWSGGVAYINSADNHFVSYTADKSNLSLSNNIISSFAQDSSGDIYVGTEKGGLNYFNRKTKQFKKIAIGKTNKPINVKAIAIDKNEGLWVGSAFNGLFYKAKGQKNFINFWRQSTAGKSLSAYGAHALLPCDSGVWIGTSRNGLNFYDFKTKEITILNNRAPYSEIADHNIKHILLDSKENLWVSTYNGLFRINLLTDDIITFSTNATEKHKTKVDEFNNTYELSNGDIYIGTNSDGVYTYSYKTDSLSSFNANGILRKLDAYGIVEADNGNIWITSNNGIICVEDNNIRHFMKSDGLQSNIFNPNAIFKDSDGTLYFGGTNGFSLFSSNKVNTNKRPPNILFESITTNNQVIIPKHIDLNRFETINLSSDQNNVSFDYSADNYLLPRKNKFKYRLINYIDQWSEPSPTAHANFLNLPAGSYVFEVVACNNDGIWNPHATKIPFTIAQHWYKTNAAILFYIIIALIVAFIIAKISLARIRLKRELELERIQRESHDEANEIKLRFFTNVSHEFRTPLTLISLPLSKLLKSENLEPEQKKQLETINRSSTRLLQLVNQILDLRKIGNSKVQLSIEKLNIVELINQQILDFNEEIANKNINLKFTHSENHIPIEGDKDKLGKVIYNILSNAFKFISDDGTITIQVSTDNITPLVTFKNQVCFGKCQAENKLSISISDDGNGIDEEDISKVFERFQQGRRNKNRNSTGIGLSLCKEYTLMHHGQISVQSTVGEGTNFSIELPMNHSEQNTDSCITNKPVDLKLKEASNYQDNNLKHSITSKNKSILIVEDSDELREYTKNILSPHFTTLTATNGDNALQIVKSSNIDLILTDIMMPVMNGLEFCKIIKSQLETSHIPVILLTALSSEENMVVGLDYGADAYISKPFNEDVLLSQIHNLLTQRERVRDSYATNFIANKAPTNLGNLDNYFLNKINSIIEENITNEQFSVELMAEKIGISRSQLHRKMKQITNMTNSDYIMMIRIKKATELLSERKYTIDEVSYKTGFSSHSYFSKCFKKIHNITPKEFVQNL